MNLEEIMEKEYYVVRCENFVYYPKVVHVTGVGASTYDGLLLYTIDNYDITGRVSELPYEELIRYDSYEQCKKRCDMLNNLPRNKKRATKWNSPETQEKLRELASIRESESE